MPYSTNANGSDLDKLYTALHDFLASFGSIDGLLQAFGLSSLPTAHRYGILFGLVVFVGTITAVLLLLVVGGSFERIKVQAVTGESTILSAGQARRGRALLYEQLLDARRRMVAAYGNDDENNDEDDEDDEDATATSPSGPTTASAAAHSSGSGSSSSPLLRLLLHQAPSKLLSPPHLLNEKGGDENKKPNKNNNKSSKQQQHSTATATEQFVPPMYKENYVKAYRRCQDRPGGPVLSGRPEARYEAYARAYAGCGPYTAHPYRCSYARRCESWACHSHEANDRHNIIFDDRPYDLLGQYVRLEALNVQRHAAALFQVTTGTAMAGHKSFDPQEIWAFQPEGPFGTIAELERSFLFPSSSSTDHHHPQQQQRHSAAFAMVDMVTDALVGVIRLTNDDPHHLSIQLEPPILPPQYQKSMKQLEACFLLLDRLFALGYRRIQLSIDTQDIDGQQLATRLRCVLEGILRKHKVVKDANRDSKIYSLINSDWKTTAVRAHLFGILYGASMLAYDRANEAFETEQEEKEDFARQREKQQPPPMAAVVAPQQLEAKKLV